MKLFRDILQTFRVVRSGSWASLFLRGDEEGAASKAELVNGFAQSTWVYSCVRAISEQVSQAEFRFSAGQKRGERIMESGPLFDLFEKPHEHTDRFLFWEMIVAQWLLRGSVYVAALDAQGAVLEIKEGRAGKADSLVVLGADRVRRVVRNHVLLGYSVRTQDEDLLSSAELLPTELLCLRSSNPMTQWDGFAPYAVAALAAQTDYASAQFMKGMMLNNADSGATYTTDQQLSAEQREQLESALRSRKRKAGTADRPLVLFGGLKQEQPKISTADLQFLENRKFNRQEICAIFGVPQEIIGFTEDANRSVSEVARLSFIENRIAPLCARLEAFIEPVVRLFGRDLFGWFDIDALPPMEAARRARYTGAQVAWSMGVPLNVCNEVFALGLPRLPHGDTSYLPFSVQPVGQGETDSEPNAATPESDAGDDEASSRALAAFHELKARLIAPPAPPAHVCAPSPVYEASIAGAVKLLEGKVRKFFFEQRGRVLEALEREFGNKSTTRALGDVFNADDEARRMLERMKPALLADLEFGGAQLWKEFDLTGFAVPPERAILFLKTREKAIEALSQDTFQKLTGSLQEGLSAGETFQELAARVKQYYTTATESRAETVALTETNIAVNSGRFIGMKEVGADLKAWISSNLANVRPEHLAAEKDYADGIRIDEPFMVGGEPLLHPGDPQGSPGNVINCRCHVIALRADKNMRAARMLSFEEFWAAKKSETKSE